MGQNITTGDLVVFKQTCDIDLLDLINRKKNYSKYMMVLSIIDNVKPACKVLCANGDINWVSIRQIEKI